MKTLEGLNWRQIYDEHMGCTKAVLDYLGVDVSLPWLFGGTGNAFVLNMNDTVFVDAAQAWDTSMLFDLAPNLGYTVERFHVDHETSLAMPESDFRAKQREAYDFVRVRIDAGLPCYAWEVRSIPAYYMIYGYDDDGYAWSVADDRGHCPWDRLGTYDVKQVAVNCVRPTEPRPDVEAVRAMLMTVLDRIERPDGWSIGPRYRTGLPAYDMWAEALEAGRANRDGGAYITHVWMEARENAVDFLAEAQGRLPDACRGPLGEAEGHYTVVRDKLRALLAMWPERHGADWTSTDQIAEGAALVRDAAAAEAKGVAALKRALAALG